MEFGVFGTWDWRKIVDLAGSRPEAGVDGDLQGVFGDGGGVGVVAREGVPVGDEVEAFVGGIGFGA